MSSPAMQRLRGEILNLPERERAELAQELMSSLDGQPDSDVAASWDAEIQRRLDQLDAGTAKVLDRKEFAARMRQRLSRL